MFGQEALHLVRELGHEVVGVSAPRTGHDGRPDRLWERAGFFEVPRLPVGELNATTLPDGVDLIVCAHSHDFIGRATRQKARLGAIGYHPSLLPLHRGRDAIKWTIRDGDKVTGGSIYWLNDTVDGGPVAAQDWCFARPDDTPESLWRRELFPMGIALLEKTLEDIERGVLVQIPQDTALASWEPSFNPPPLKRPDLPMLTDGRAAGVRVVVTREDARLIGSGQRGALGNSVEGSR
jgi:methionyl-tRNA formyltransferase